MREEEVRRGRVEAAGALQESEVRGARALAGVQRVHGLVREAWDEAEAARVVLERVREGVSAAAAAEAAEAEVAAAALTAAAQAQAAAQAAAVAAAAAEAAEAQAMEKARIEQTAAAEAAAHVSASAAAVAAEIAAAAAAAETQVVRSSGGVQSSGVGSPPKAGTRTIWKLPTSITIGGVTLTNSPRASSSASASPTSSPSPPQHQQLLLG